MMWRRGRQRLTGEGLGEMARTAFCACVLASVLISTVAVLAAARTIEIGPRVGDILVFRHNVHLADDWQIDATRIAGGPEGACALVPNVMTDGGGSLVVEERQPDQLLFRVHWAGPRTSDGSMDCGSTADLLVSRADLQLLTNAIGGPGVEHRLFQNF